MGSIELTPTPEEKKSPQSSDLLLTDSEREQANKLGANPLDLLGTTESKSYIKGLIEESIPTSKAFQTLAAQMAHPVGFFLLIPDDLTANSGEYVYTHTATGLQYLYCNGAAVSQTTYADLYAFWGASKYAADSGGNFSLPDTRGRTLFLAGTNAATDVGDNDGVTESSRQPKHQHTVASITVANESSHTHGAGSYAFTDTFGSGATGIGSGALTNIQYNASSSVTGTSGAGSSHTHSLSGSAGSGMSGSDAVAHIVIGSLVVRF